MTWTQVISDYARQRRNVRSLVVGASLVALLVAMIFGYRYYAGYYNQRAHSALASAIELYERAERENTKALWSDADRALGQGYKEYSNSTLAPYFLAFQAEIARLQGRADDARALLERALSILSKTSPLYNAYALKLAMMKIDSGDAGLVNDGTSSITALASDAKNRDRDMALYYQGLLAFDSGDRAAAEKSWNVLIEKYGAQSTWAQVAQAKLEYTA
jgi:predicted negative regulator of RcsB-dependent stress response